MADESFQDILASSGFVLVSASPEFVAWLEARKVPRTIIDLLADGLPGRQKRRKRWHDHWDFLDEIEIQKEAGEFPRYLKAGLLSIGSGPSGDPVAIDVRKQIGAIGFISHDEVWGDDDVRVRKYFVVVAPSLAEFARQARDKLLPIDYYQAKET